MANKVKFGLSNVVAFPISNNTEGAITYDDPIKLPGAVSLTAEGVGDSNNFYADNTIYYSSSSSAGYDIELETALFPDEFLVKCCGLEKDSNGAIVETTKNVEKAPFALAFQFEGDKEATRHIYHYCTGSQPNTEGSTIEDSIEPQTETISISASGDANGNIKSKCLKGNSGYDTFFSTPYTPSFAD